MYWRGTRLDVCEVSTRLEVRPTLGPDGAPIRNPCREVMSIAYGFFSPLEGFMPWNEVESVLRERRLLSGWLLPFPIVFDVTEEELKASSAKPGDDLLLTLRGRPFAVLKVEEVYKLPDRGELADAVFGTPERNGEVVKKRFDEKHPGWLIYRSLKPLAIAGKVTIINPPRFREPYSRFWTPPAASRKLIEAKGWKIVVAHQMRNVPHIGHEMLMKRAMFVAGGDRPGDAVLVNAIIGAKRPGDYVDEAILEGHEALALSGYFAGGRHGASTGGTICEVPIRYRRRVGRKKLGLRHVLHIAWDMAALALRYNLAFFLSFAAALLALPGLGIAAWIAYKWIFLGVEHYVRGIIAFALVAGGVSAGAVAVLTLYLKRMEIRILRALRRQSARAKTS